ncbi:MAG: hypothetical protein J6V44_12325 [Methanobrevibacter sp.]|nr:hypothetical protein [Methanobrevibacter sp.]
MFGLSYETEQEVVIDQELQFKKSLANDVYTKLKELGIPFDMLADIKAKLAGLDLTEFNTPEELIDRINNIIWETEYPDTYIYEVELDGDAIKIDKT